MNFLLYPALDAQALEQLQVVSATVTLINAASPEEALAAIPEADAMYGTLTPPLLAAARRLRWLQTPIAGLEHYMFPELAASHLTMTNMAGIYSDHIADHAMAYVLTFARGFHLYLRRQLARAWQPGVPVVHLADQTLGIVGLGGIGSEIARRAAACGMRVIATDARLRVPPAAVSVLWDTAQLPRLLAEADFVLSCVPHTPETVGLIGMAELRMMKPSAFLINISRGVVVDLAALTQALQEGLIAGAGLDVFAVEPLPADHPLWGMENVIITPHVAAASPHVARRRIEVVAQNLRRFLAGEPLHNVVNKQIWF